MIKPSEIISIGTLLKPHGIKGEVSADIDCDVNLEALKCIVVDIDGIFVPFFISAIRPGASSATLLTIDGVASEHDAKEFCGKEIFALKSDMPQTEDTPGEDGFYLADLIGFTIVTDDGQTIGEITNFDDSTNNVLLIVNADESGDTIFIPLADEYISEIDADSRKIVMSLPAGLLEINNNPS